MNSLIYTREKKVNMNPVTSMTFPPGVPGPGVNFGSVYNAMTSAIARYSAGLTPESVSVFSSDRTNSSIVYSYPIYPWSDGTHEKLSEYTLVFLQKHMDGKYKMVNLVPLWRLNILLRTDWDRFQLMLQEQDDEAQRFNALLIRYGNHGLQDYHIMTQKGLPLPEVDPDLVEFYKLSLQKQWMHLTRFGIEQNYTFIGAVVSKMESTGPGAILDMHSHTQMIYNVGVCTGQWAEVSNVWNGKSKVVPGSRLYLLLQRTLRADKKPWNYEFTPYATNTIPVPFGKNFEYQDENGRTLRAIPYYVGRTYRNVEREPDRGTQEMAAGLTGGVESSSGKTATLPIIEVLIGL
jgi:hypothetical protein